MTAQEEVIKMLLAGYAQTPTEAVAAHEIRALLARIAELEAELAKRPVEKSAEEKRPRK